MVTYVIFSKIAEMLSFKKKNFKKLMNEKLQSQAVVFDF